MPTFNIPGTLLAVWFVWFAVQTIGLSSVFGWLTFATGIAWFVVSVGLVGKLRG